MVYTSPTETLSDLKSNFSYTMISWQEKVTFEEMMIIYGLY
jgi:hypothetical protein